MDSASDAPIALVGLMGAGKSAVASSLARRLGATALDLDAALEAEAGQSVATLLREGGEAAFRAREAAALERALASGARVIACGGGAVLDAASRARLRDRCRAVWLQVSPAEALRRIGDGVAARPLLDPARPLATLERLLEERAERYREVACLSVPTDGRSPDQVAAAIADSLGLAAR
jgi:shikimate kinase